MKEHFNFRLLYMIGKVFTTVIVIFYRKKNIKREFYEQNTKLIPLHN